MIIGITGSSGAGKTTVCKLLAEKYNIKIIDADDIARKLSKECTDYVKDIVKEFGNDIVDEKGRLRRKKLAEIIYLDKEKREQLNQCTFKFIKKEIEVQIKKANEEIIVIDAPLLFECELDKMCDKIIGVVSKKKLQLDRIIERDNVGYEHATMRLKAQPDDAFYKRKCDIIIKNNGNIEDLKKQIECLQLIS